MDPAARNDDGRQPATTKPTRNNATRRATPNNHAPRRATTRGNARTRATTRVNASDTFNARALTRRDA
eukprot:7116677-Lingulodinium_polyedra.AAC.1